MREFRTPGSVRGAPGNGRPYRDNPRKTASIGIRMYILLFAHYNRDMCPVTGSHFVLPNILRRPASWQLLTSSTIVSAEAGEERGGGDRKSVV